ncbi:hypothetical protein PbJCM13498_33290 [Prolixibacter bellariivorans]|uniref:Type I restriction modification DNA specificity domain-containing protein n=1 Tax=Prolixibacter bellariivorans TaxID=314319 RepID=A0A5M4B3L5_9BACT|nr:restriction endonuclease subunit S [Prolixibacter bellariivorans]GET34466.1 hypothetical protein PbJCM13498_33290 [Prolixibacter bellariivorans]
MIQPKYQPLGKYIREVNIRNKELKVKRLLGVSIQKMFMPSIANTVGTNMANYKIVKRNQFAYGPVTSRNGDKISVALLEEYDEVIISQAYTSFEIIQPELLHPEYLMMWFRRPEFDRFARFMSHGSTREVFGWEEMCNVYLPIPSPEKQREIVSEYNTVKNRITLNNQIIQKLEETAQTIYKQWFVDFEFPISAKQAAAMGQPELEGKPYKSSGGKMVYNEELGKEIPEGWSNSELEEICRKIGSGATPKGGKKSYQKGGISLIRSTNIHDYRFSEDNLAFLNAKQAEELKNAVVESKDILLNITGVSVARCAIVPDYVLPARVNQHVMIIRPKSGLNINFYLEFFLCSSESKSKLLGISQAGSTREAITKSDVEKFQVVIPSKVLLRKFQSLVSELFEITYIKRREINNLVSLKELLYSKLVTIEN